MQLMQLLEKWLVHRWCVPSQRLRNSTANGKLSLAWMVTPACQQKAFSYLLTRSPTFVSQATPC